MKPIIKLAAIGVGALLLGLFLAYPLFPSNIHPADKFPGGHAYITVDPVYAYFALAPFNNSVPGFWQNLQFSPQHTTLSPGLASYLIILNITSYCKAPLYMESLRVDADKYIQTTNNFSVVSWWSGAGFLSVTRTTNGVDDRLHQVYPTATRWEPNESRLVAFSGITEISNTTLLKTGNFYIGGSVDGTPIDGTHSLGVGSKQVQLVINGNEFLYNNLLGPNQVLRFDWDGQIAYVDEAQ
jgi:hypothetical protein